MNYYETLYIVHPALESGRLKDIILSLEEKLKNLGGKVLSIDLWGKKRLAYLIDKQKYGTYVKLQFTGVGNCTGSFEMELEHNPNVLSYLTTLIEESDVVEQKNDLDIQIAGQSRPAFVKFRWHRSHRPAPGTCRSRQPDTLPLPVLPAGDYW